MQQDRERQGWLKNKVIKNVIGNRSLFSRSTLKLWWIGDNFSPITCIHQATSSLLLLSFFFFIYFFIFSSLFLFETACTNSRASVLTRTHPVRPQLDQWLRGSLRVWSHSCPGNVKLIRTLRTHRTCVHSRGTHVRRINTENNISRGKPSVLVSETRRRHRNGGRDTGRKKKCNRGCFVTTVQRCQRFNEHRRAVDRIGRLPVHRR